MTDQMEKYIKILEATYNLHLNKIKTEEDKLEVDKDRISEIDYKRAISLLEIEKKSASVNFNLIQQYASAISDMSIDFFGYSNGLGKQVSSCEECSTNSCAIVCHRCTASCTHCVSDCAGFRCSSGCTRCTACVTRAGT